MAATNRKRKPMTATASARAEESVAQLKQWDRPYITSKGCLHCYTPRTIRETSQEPHRKMSAACDAKEVNAKLYKYKIFSGGAKRGSFVKRL